MERKFEEERKNFLRSSTSSNNEFLEQIKSLQQRCIEKDGKIQELESMVLFYC